MRQVAVSPDALVRILGNHLKNLLVAFQYNSLDIDERNRLNRAVQMQSFEESRVLSDNVDDVFTMQPGLKILSDSVSDLCETEEQRTQTCLRGAIKK